jgi:anti-sigma B factor antagonist
MNGDGFDIGLRRDHRRWVVQVRGDLDVLTTPRLQEALRQACQEPPTDVVVDLSGVPFMDASALRALAATAGELGHSGCRVIVQGLSPLQDRAMRICGLEKLLTIA